MEATTSFSKSLFRACCDVSTAPFAVRASISESFTFHVDNRLRTADRVFLGTISGSSNECNVASTNSACSPPARFRRSLMHCGEPGEDGCLEMALIQIFGRDNKASSHTLFWRWVVP